MKKRQMYRRVTIIAVVVGVLLLLIFGFYFAYSAANALNPYVGKPVSSSDFATLQRLSLPPYGPSNATMLSEVKGYSGSPFTSGSKPVIVYIGAEFCPYCAVQRWSLIIALMRFGNFSNLVYMASSPSEGDYPTFTFLNSTYTSKYLIFQSFEQEDRNYNPLQTVPSNYTAVFSQYGSAYPFIDFGNKYIVSGAMILPNRLGGLNWAAVLNDISTNATIGSEIRQSANVITGVICKLTNGQPSSVCSQSPINNITRLVSYDTPPPGTVLQAWAPASLVAPWAAAPKGNQREQAEF